MEIYLDHAATTPVAPQVREAMRPFLEEEHGNPSSRHRAGVRAREAVDRARRAVARATGGAPEHVIFTAGGTEANNLAVLGFCRMRPSATGDPPHVLVGPTEHPAVVEPAAELERRGFVVERLRLDAAGELDLEHLRASLRPTTVLVAQMLVNNELGTVYPVARLARIVRAEAPRAVVHVDAVQGIGKLELSLGELGAHSLSISAHKIHGPKGAGALVIDGSVEPAPLIFGGGQERGLRSGTENVPGIVGLGCAAHLADEHRPEAAASMGALRTLLAEELGRLAGAELLAPGSTLSPAIAAVLLPGAPAEAWMHHLEERGIATSVGSACHAGRDQVPPSLLALGLDEHAAKRVLRLSFARTTTPEEVRAALDALVDVEARLRA